MYIDCDSFQTFRRLGKLWGVERWYSGTHPKSLYDLSARPLLRPRKSSRGKPKNTPRQPPFRMYFTERVQFRAVQLLFIYIFEHEHYALTIGRIVNASKRDSSKFFCNSQHTKPSCNVMLTIVRYVHISQICRHFNEWFFDQMRRRKKLQTYSDLPTV